MSAPNSKDWQAWEDRQPPNPPGPTLHVSGEVETTNGGIVPILQEAVPQGINPSILLLRLTLKDTGPGTADVNFRPAKFEKDVKEGQYTQVSILWDSDIVATVDVDIVS